MTIAFWAQPLLSHYCTITTTYYLYLYSMYWHNSYFQHYYQISIQTGQALSNQIKQWKKETITYLVYDSSPRYSLRKGTLLKYKIIWFINSGPQVEFNKLWDTIFPLNLLNVLGFWASILTIIFLQVIMLITSFQRVHTEKSQFKLESLWYSTRSPV